jgi:hypothetical protein
MELARSSWLSRLMGVLPTDRVVIAGAQSATAVTEVTVRSGTVQPYASPVTRTQPSSLVGEASLRR